MSEIRSPITGSVFRLESAQGDTVAPGDVVAILESMKLEIPVESEVAGTITEVHCAEGDSVGEDDIMFTVE
jgi:acetyl-CoA carboxylase biotin carboxyl carrier protein